jgi:SAM-dependent methyltransferase
MTQTFQWPWRSWRTSIATAIRRVVRLELELAEDRLDARVTQRLGALEAQTGERFRTALETSQNSLRTQLAFELADVIESHQALARTFEQLSADSLALRSCVEETAKQAHAQNDELKARLSSQSEDIAAALPERIGATVDPIFQRLASDLNDRTERAAHRATVETAGLSAVIDDMREMLSGQGERLAASQHRNAVLLAEIQQHFRSSPTEQDLHSTGMNDFKAALNDTLETLIKEIKSGADSLDNVVSNRLSVIEDFLNNVERTLSALKSDGAERHNTIEGKFTAQSNAIVEQTANRTFDLVSNRLLPMSNKEGEIENSVAEARLAIAQGVERISNLLQHLTTSLHSRLNEWENERLPAVVSQIHEVAAIGLDNGQDRRAPAGEKHRALPGERYQPADPQPFDAILKQASQDFPKIFPEWKVRLDEIEKAFAETKIGNAANARDLYSNMFSSFVARHAEGRILDVGSGVFGRPYYLRSYPGELVSGIEPLPLIEAADFELVRGLGEYLPWPDGSFSTVLSGTSLDHCLSLDRTFDEIVRVLTDQGAALFWIDSIKGSPAYTPDAEDFKPADKFHLFHFDTVWLEPLLEQRFEIRERMIFDRPGFSKVFYALKRSAK